MATKLWLMWGWTTDLCYWLIREWRWTKSLAIEDECSLLDNSKNYTKELLLPFWNKYWIIKQVSRYGQKSETKKTNCIGICYANFENKWFTNVKIYLFGLNI
jgi:hypothetical protein